MVRRRSGLSARRLQRTTYSLGSRGTDDLGELDRRTVLVTAGADVGEHALFSEFVAWGIDPKTGSVLTWGLMYRIVGGAPDDSIEDAELWRAWERVVDGSVWRHAGYDGARIPAQRVLIDSGYRPEIVRGWCEAKYGQQLHQHGSAAAVLPAPYGARILPLKSKSRETGEHPVDLGAGTKRPYRQMPRFPALVGLESNQIKDAIYESVLRDNRLPEGAPRSNHWPVDREAKGYTEAWFREFANEVKTIKRTPRGAITTQWTVKAGQGKANEAWDGRVYATGAAMLHVWPHSLQVGLIRLALADAGREGSAWSAEEADALRRHLAEAGGADYATGGDNVTPLR